VTVAITNDVTSKTLPDLAQGLVNLVNTTAALQGSDGVAAEDFMSYDPSTGQAYPRFNLRARSAGWNAAQLQANLSSSSTYTVQPSGTQTLDSNLPDLYPRNHLYVTAGLTNLPLTFAFNTTTQADGYHELTAVVYEGSHVRTQKRIAQTVRIQNSALSARLPRSSAAATHWSGQRCSSRWSRIPTPRRSSCSALGARSAASPINPNATFSVVGTNLGSGLHPFYAVVAASSASSIAPRRSGYDW